MFGPNQIGGEGYYSGVYEDLSVESQGWQGWKVGVPVSPEMSNIGKVVQLWSDVVNERDPVDTATHFRIKAATCETSTPMREQIYKDAMGELHKHWSHTKQVPLPEALIEGVSQNVIQVMNAQDYRLEFDADKVNQELIRNSEMAKIHLAENENPDFVIADDRVDGNSGIIKLQYKYRPTDVEYSTDKGVGVASSIGFRDSMEDAHVVGQLQLSFGGREESVYYSAVFDGHGGGECAEHAKNTFEGYFTERMNDRSLNFPSRELRIVNALNFAFADISRSFQDPDQGSTANLCIVIGDELWVANLGDSRALLVTPEKTIQLSEDQKPSMPENIKLIEGRGAHVDPSDGRIYHDLSHYKIAPGRSFGDHHLKGGMYPRPVITRFKLPENIEGCYLVQACDGVFDVASSEQVGQVVRQVGGEDEGPAQIAYAVAASAYDAKAEDNTTILVAPLGLIKKD